MNKTSKSRIPVPVTKKISSNLCNDEKNWQTRSNFLKDQNSDACKVAKIHLNQQKTERKICSQPKNLIDEDIKNPDFKNKQTLLKTNPRYGNININNKISEKSDDKNKLITCKGNVKPNLENKKIMKTFNKKINVNSRKTLPPSEKTSTVKSDIRYGNININNKISEKSDDKNKFITCKSNVKPNLENKGMKTFNKKINVNSRMLPSSEKTFTVKSDIAEKSIESKKENLPSLKSYPFEVEKCTLKENEQDCFPAHENVEFEANELFRKMILSNKELSPSMCKLMPSLRLSSLQSQRPSVYQKFEIPENPLKEALKALENTCFSVKRIKQKDKLPQSPYKDRDSIYTPYGDPNQAFLKRLEDYKQKQLQKTASKSTKKVTFNLNIQECTPKNVCDIQQNPLKNSEHRLVQINENSKENTPNSPQSGKNDEIKESDIVPNEIISVDNKDSVMKVDDKDATECKDAKAADKSDTTSKSDQRTIVNITPDILLHQNRMAPLQKLKGISCWNSPDLAWDSKNNTCTNGQETNNMQLPEQKNLKRNAKICTPKPISFSSKSKMNQNYSPEFLVNGKSTLITDFAPIYTPLVLKSQAKSALFSPEAEEGPIPLKLDFREEEKESPKKETCKNHTSIALDNIVTTRKKLDYLADQECCQSLLNENFPVICGRYLTNPVATILNEGDDMHFIPIQP